MQHALCVCPEQARQLVMDYLEPMAENGHFDELHKIWLQELAPYAKAAAERTLYRSLWMNHPEKILRELRKFLAALVNRFEPAALNPDAIELVVGDPTAMLRTVQDLKDWIHFIDTHTRFTDARSAASTTSQEGAAK